VEQNPPRSGRSEINTERIENIDSVRSTMSTSRAQTALAALTAEKQALESKLQQIESILEAENRRSVNRPRGKK